jgi:hypothetical protein
VGGGKKKHARWVCFHLVNVVGEKKKKGGVGRGGVWWCRGEGGGRVYAFLNGIDGKREKRSNQLPTKKIVGWPTHQVIYHMGFTWVLTWTKAH